MLRVLHRIIHHTVSKPLRKLHPHLQQLPTTRQLVRKRFHGIPEGVVSHFGGEGRTRFEIGAGGVVGTRL
jgi:hypothetical protein